MMSPNHKLLINLLLIKLNLILKTWREKLKRDSITVD